jgi:hypothetical protein
MLMKKLLIPILIICIGIIVWYIWPKNNSGTPEVLNSNPIVNGHPDASNATFLFEEGAVTLKNGTASSRVSPDSSATVETDLRDIYAYGDLNSDGKEDAVVVLMQSGGGSGTFFSIAGYISGPVGYKGTGTAFIGDRVEIKSISVKGKRITVTYLGRRDDEPFAAEPTVLITKTFLYSSIDNSINEE